MPGPGPAGGGGFGAILPTGLCDEEAGEGPGGGWLAGGGLLVDLRFELKPKF